MFIFDDPLQNVNNETEAASIFKNVIDFLIQNGKTVVVTTTNEDILKLCNRIYVLDDGYLSESYEYDDLRVMTSFRRIINDERLHKLSCR